MRNTKKITILVSEETACELERLSRRLKISRGEVVERLAVQSGIEDPLRAASISLTDIFVITRGQNQAAFLDTINMIMAALGQIFIESSQISRKGLWRLLEKELDQLSCQLKKNRASEKEE